MVLPLISMSRQPHRILQALRRYVRAENKDRQHTIRHYQHVLAVDPEKAAQMKSQVSCLTSLKRFSKMLFATTSDACTSTRNTEEREKTQSHTGYKQEHRHIKSQVT